MLVGCNEFSQAHAMAAVGDGGLAAGVGVWCKCVGTSVEHAVGKIGGFGVSCHMEVHCTCMDIVLYQQDWCCLDTRHKYKYN